ncbi:MAG: lysophospholipid acyltransferase family protein [Victivallales bacterium]|jgi:KDO2-lipid IV(A) lauroyltransferase|nr:lysophospholipid acyltransferase family protein [Victivallales bacterium]
MAKEKREKSNLRIYAEYYPFCLLYGVLHLLPLKVGYAFSTLLFRLLYVFDRRHRVRTVQHVMHAGLYTDPVEARKFARKTYLEFAKLLVEIVKMNQLYSKDKISLAGSPESVEYIDPGDGKVGGQVIIVTAHYGNWEVAGTAFSEQANRPMTSFMRPFGNPLIGKLILDHRAGSLHELVDKNEGIRPILRAASAGRNITMLIDQHASSKEGIVCDFFGHPARIHMTPALLHLKTGIPIIPELNRRKAGNNFEFEIVYGDLIRYVPTGDKQHDIQTICQMCASALEKLIKEDPVQWLWAPRHWLDINRRQAEQYKNWTSPLKLQSVSSAEKTPSKAE